jgi:hypothetical protein
MVKSIEIPSRTDTAGLSRARRFRGFMTGKPDAPCAAPAIERMKQFIRKHTTG